MISYVISMDWAIRLDERDASGAQSKELRTIPSLSLVGRWYRGRSLRSLDATLVFCRCGTYMRCDARGRLVEEDGWRSRRGKRSDGST